MTRTLYTLLTRLLLPLFFLRLLWRARKSPAYRLRWRERLALYPVPANPASDTLVLFHAVSVGEVHAAQPLVSALLAARPDLRVLITCTTPTGSARIRQLFGASVQHVYLPYDLPGAMRRLLDQFHPALVVLLETELWPNLLHGCRARGIPVVLANARLSERSFGRYRKHAALAHAMLQEIDVVVAQAMADGERFVALGLPRERLLLNGSLKFDVAVDSSKLAAAQALKAQWQGRPVWVAASTREGEEAKVLRAHQWVLGEVPDALLVLVPRHPERFAEVAAQSTAAGLVTQRYSAGDEIALATQVLVGDTMGDMYFYYGLADLAFVGGSLVNTGCQNLIEPAALGLPVVSGPSLFNFQAVSALLREAGGLQVVAHEQELAELVTALLHQPGMRMQRGAAAKAVVMANQGATSRLLALLLARLPETPRQTSGQGRD